MTPQQDAACQWILKEFIKKQIIILGPMVTILKARKIPGLLLDESGNISKTEADPGLLLTGILKEFALFSPVTSKFVFDSIISASPDLKTALALNLDNLYSLFSESDGSGLATNPSLGGNLSQDIRSIQNDSQAFSAKEEVGKGETEPKPKDAVSYGPGSFEKLDSSKVEEIGKIFEGVSQEEKVNTLN